MASQPFLTTAAAPATGAWARATSSWVRVIGRDETVPRMRRSISSAGSLPWLRKIRTLGWSYTENDSSASSDGSSTPSSVGREVKSTRIS
ncbi:MAG: hypothetical protein AB2L07_16920 [Thermoanaerobaculaceae bacterium]